MEKEKIIVHGSKILKNILISTNTNQNADF